jgi:hypothetical protein
MELRAETMSLTAGRELDAMVAEKVMGWQRELGSFAGTQTWHPEVVSLVRPSPSGYRRHPTTGDLTYFGGIPSYSTDISAAWLIVERMRGLGWLMLLDDCDPFGFRCVWQTTSPDLTDVVGDGATAPLAICRAALAAVGAT